MVLNDLLLLGAAGGGTGLIFGFWGQIRDYLSRFKDLFIQTVYIYDEANDEYGGAGCFHRYLIYYYLRTKYRRGFTQPISISVSSKWVRPLKSFEKVANEAPVYNQTTIFWNYLFPLFFNWNEQSIYFLRGTFDHKKLEIDALEFYKKNKSENNYRYNIIYIVGKKNKEGFLGGGKNDSQAPGTNSSRPRPSHNNDINDLVNQFANFYNYKKEEIGPELNEKKNYIFTSPELQTVFDKVMFWKNSKNWYLDRCIPWKLGLGFKGPPGTGKTFFARVLAEELNVPVYVFDLATLTNEEFREGWKEMLSNTPAMVLIEDIDSAFNKRVNTNPNQFKDHLTFDCLLNCVDGVQKTDGVLFVLTTNKIELVDDALLRPGRVDICIEIGLPNEKALRSLCQRILKDNPETWEELIRVGLEEKDSMAKFTRRCASLAEGIFLKKLA